MFVLKDLIEAGKITPVIDATYPLSEVPEAIRHLEEGHAPRKNRHHRVRRVPAGRQLKRHSRTLAQARGLLHGATRSVVDGEGWST